MAAVWQGWIGNVLEKFAIVFEATVFKVAFFSLPYYFSKVNFFEVHIEHMQYSSAHVFNRANSFSMQVLTFVVQAASQVK